MPYVRHIGCSCSPLFRLMRCQRAPFMGASALGTAGLLPRYVQQYSSTLP